MHRLPVLDIPCYIVLSSSFDWHGGQLSLSTDCSRLGNRWLHWIHNTMELLECLVVSGHWTHEVWLKETRLPTVRWNCCIFPRQHSNHAWSVTLQYLPQTALQPCLLSDTAVSPPDSTPTMPGQWHCSISPDSTPTMPAKWHCSISPRQHSNHVWSVTLQYLPRQHSNHAC